MNTPRRSCEVCAMSRLFIANCRLFDSPQRPVSISVRDGLIEGIGDLLPPPHVEVLEAGGRIVAPGFIDLHVQGAGGGDVLDGTVEALQAISRTCARFGVTGFLATTVFRPGGDNRHLEVAARCVGEDLGGARLLGIHIEGPFISPKKRGMILPDCICPPSERVLDEITSLTGGSLRMMTIAPELEGSLRIVERLVEGGVVASLGHTNASYEEALEGIRAGISHVTHLFNAMTPFHHREPGALLAVLESEGVTAQIITDGVHIHPRVIKWAFKLLGEGRCIPITDGMRAMGLPEGRYIYSGLEYEVRDGVARYVADGTLIGTALGLNEMVRRLMDFTGCGLEAAIKTATENPARVLGLEGKLGRIGVGAHADLVILEEDLSVWATVVGGKVVFRAEGG